jgi:hypothetical protein
LLKATYSPSIAVTKTAPRTPPTKILPLLSTKTM